MGRTWGLYFRLCLWAVAVPDSTAAFPLGPLPLKRLLWAPGLCPAAVTQIRVMIGSSEREEHCERELCAIGQVGEKQGSWASCATFSQFPTSRSTSPFHPAICPESPPLPSGLVVLGQWEVTTGEFGERGREKSELEYLVPPILSL